ncbi:MAG: flagellin, partial [Desulfatirhabdiaceae bacterium]
RNRGQLYGQHGISGCRRTNQYCRINSRRYGDDILQLTINDVAVTVGAGVDTAQEIAAAINAAGAGVTASANTNATLTVDTTKLEATQYESTFVIGDINLASNFGASDFVVNSSAIDISAATSVEHLASIIEGAGVANISATTVGGNLVIIDEDASDGAAVVTSATNLGVFTGIGPDTVVAKNDLVATSLTIGTTDIDLSEALDLEDVANEINNYSTSTGVTASVVNDELVLANITGANITVAGDAALLTGTSDIGTHRGTVSLVSDTSAPISIGGAAPIVAGLSETGGDLKINGASVSLEGASSLNQVVSTINNTVDGVVASASTDGKLVLNSVSGLDIKITGDAADNVLGAAATNVVRGTISLVSDTGADIKIASNALEANSANEAGFADQGGSSDAVGSGLSVETLANANNAIDRIDDALDKVAENRAELGAVQNRLDSTISNLMNASENFSAANGRLIDADFAAETSAMSKQQIMMQAGVAMLAQAKQLPQQVLQLLQ